MSNDVHWLFDADSGPACGYAEPPLTTIAVTFNLADVTCADCLATHARSEQEQQTQWHLAHPEDYTRTRCGLDRRRAFMTVERAIGTPGLHICEQCQPPAPQDGSLGLSETEMERAFQAFKDGVAGRGYIDKGPAMDGLRAALEALIPAHTERAWEVGYDTGYDTGYEDQRYRDTTKPMPTNPYSQARQEQSR